MNKWEKKYVEIEEEKRLLATQFYELTKRFEEASQEVESLKVNPEKVKVISFYPNKSTRHTINDLDTPIKNLAISKLTLRELLTGKWEVEETE